MALHIQMSDEALATLKRTARRNNLSSIAACLALIGLGGGILFFTVLFIEGEIASPFTPYTAPIENAPPSKKPKVKEMTTKTSSSSIAPSVIVSSSSSIVSMADVKIATPDISLGMSIDLDLGSGLGSGLGEATVGLGGETGGGSALEGTFYDFKLTRSGAATPIAKNKNRTVIVLHEFFSKRWSPRVLQKYYSAPVKLYASNFLIPSCDAKIAPRTFKAMKSEPSALAVIYRGKVRAPKTGNFRFVGIGDDLIAVRFNNKMVLESGWAIPSQHKEGDNSIAARGMGATPAFLQQIATGKSPDHKDYQICKVDNIGEWATIFKGLIGGTPFHVVEGREYPIEILISEIPGGKFGFALLIEDIDTPNIVKGKKIYDIFRTNFTIPDAAALSKELGAKVTLPVFNKESSIWTAVP